MPFAQHQFQLSFTMKQNLVLLFASGAAAFPWVAETQGVDASLLRHSTQKRAATCPFNSDHVPAAPITSQYPYNGAIDGLPGNGQGGILVPAEGDTAHEYVAPGPNDIRGPCPGLNTMANHNFLAHDGITTFNELVDAQQNVFNVGYDLAVLLATLGVEEDGDIVTQKLSIGCDATSRTSINPLLTGAEGGLNSHNKFESDTSLTRNDYYLANGDDYSFNETLFDMMDATCSSNFDIDGLSLYRSQRWHQSQVENPNFSFGPLTLLLYGAASFLYELMPSGTRGYAPDLYTISYFFKQEQIPPNWTTRATPYTVSDVNTQINLMYLKNPVLFGGNTAPGHFGRLSPLIRQ